jgi:hypothetical protein
MELEKFDEELAANPYEIIVIEQKFIKELPNDYLASFKLRYPALTSIMILTGDEVDPIKILDFFEHGWIDYLVLPPDRALVIEKIVLYATGERPQHKQVYSLKTSLRADIAKPATIEEFSEFNCIVKANFGIPEGEFIILYSTALGPGKDQPGASIARCYKTEDHPSEEGFSLNYFSFVGVAPDLMTNIRNSLRKVYVAGKNR